MRILSLINHHNSFTILTLCKLLSRKYNDIENYSVTNKKFYIRFKSSFLKYSVVPILIDSNKNTNFKNKEYIKNKKNHKTSKQIKNKFILKLFSKIKEGFINSSIYLFLREKYITLKMNYFKKKALKILKKINPDILLSINDRSYTYTEGSFLWAAKKLKIPIIITFAAQFNTSNAEIYRRDEEGNPLPNFSSNSYLSIYKLIARKVLKNQIINNVFNQHVYTLMSAKNTGIISKNSWWPGCGICDVVLVDSLYRKNLYINNMVNESKIFIVGHPDYDLIFESLKNRNIIRETISKEFSTNNDAPFIVFAVPQYYEQGDMSIQEHWKLIESYIKAIKILNVNLLLSLHPRMFYSDYKFLEEKYKCIIIKKNLSYFIGCADIFIATSSTTLNWSILCDIPTIAIYGKSYYYAHLKSINSEFDPNKLPDLIKKILKSNKSCDKEDFLKLSRDEVFFGKSLDLHYKIFKNQIKK